MIRSLIGKDDFNHGFSNFINCKSIAFIGRFGKIKYQVEYSTISFKSFRAGFVIIENVNPIFLKGPGDLATGLVYI